jgi:hypothetical protein
LSLSLSDDDNLVPPARLLVIRGPPIGSWRLRYGGLRQKRYARKCADGAKKARAPTHAPL